MFEMWRRGIEWTLYRLGNITERRKMTDYCKFCKTYVSNKHDFWHKERKEEKRYEDENKKIR